MKLNLKELWRVAFTAQEDLEARRGSVSLELGTAHHLPFQAKTEELKNQLEEANDKLKAERDQLKYGPPPSTGEQNFILAGICKLHVCDMDSFEFGNCTQWFPLLHVEQVRSAEVSDLTKKLADAATSQRTSEVPQPCCNQQRLSGFHVPDSPEKYGP